MKHFFFFKHEIFFLHGYTFALLSLRMHIAQLKFCGQKIKKKKNTKNAAICNMEIMVREVAYLCCAPIFFDKLA